MSLLNKERLRQFLAWLVEFYADGFCYYCEVKSHLKKYEAETDSLEILHQSKQTKKTQTNQKNQRKTKQNAQKPTTDMFWYPNLQTNKLNCKIIKVVSTWWLRKYRASKHQLSQCFTKSNLFFVGYATVSLRWEVHYAEKYQFQNLPPQCNRSDCFNKNGDATLLLKITTQMKKKICWKINCLSVCMPYLFLEEVCRNSK